MQIVDIFKTPGLRRKVFIVLSLLLVTRIFTTIPIPYVDTSQLSAFFSGNGLLDLFNLFSGGGLSQLSIAMLGVGPYITSSIIMQLMTMIFPNLKKAFHEEGPVGRAKFNRISRYLTVPLALLQGYSFLNLLISQNALPPLSTTKLIIDILIITAGTMIFMWIGELISEQKIGNGTSLIIFAGIVSSLPQTIRFAIADYSPDKLNTYIAFIAVAIIVIAGVVFINEGERKVPVSYARRVRGNKLFGGVGTYLPLKVNQAGVIPIIFAVSILLFPQLIATIFAAFSLPLNEFITDYSNRLYQNQLVYGIFYFLLVVLFTYFYTAITFDPAEISKGLQRSGGFIPGIRPGESTAQFLTKIITRITLPGALFLGTIAVLPNITQAFTEAQQFALGGTALLIVVAVALETRRQIESQLSLREYDK